MTKDQLTELIFIQKKQKGISWEDLGAEVGMNPVWVTSACLGMNSMPADYAERICHALDLPPGAKETLMEYPTKEWNKSVPQDPLVYRLYEVVGVYGDTLKEVIQEKFGDGIMSAIDFSLDVDKEENPAGDRVVIKMNGKFLPYKSW